ncbi:MAG: hypothetical protein IAC61_02480 [Firmicutes bacterium]|uniref:Uncharacterized protein n=1 Tax=Candidatus Alloenteromonas pullistercoris TaxID=2840785 RepID=A0A9D9GVQ8_9FIRM|nr:hypothetical protein [Candidatus Enteromonas pullistercoris]
MKKTLILTALLSGLLLGGYAAMEPLSPEMVGAKAARATSSQTSEGIYEDFESGVLSDDWTLDPYFGQTSDNDTSHYTGFLRNEAVSDRDTLSWVEKLPFNKDGTYFLNGWKGEDGAADEAASWRLLSKPFTLSGSGLITAKMGGNSCRLSLYASEDGTVDANATPLAYINTASDDGGWWRDAMDISYSKNAKGDIVGGGNNVTMRRAYLDASAYLGQKVVLALEDYRAGGAWGHALFDSINTNVSLDDFKFQIDIVSQKHKDWSQAKHVGFTDFYKSGDSKGDLASVKEAYDFLSSYYSTARSFEGLYTYCQLEEDALNEIVVAYEKLSEQAKVIVDRSDDFSYEGYLDHKDQIVYEDNIVKTPIGVSMGTLESLAAAQRAATSGLFSVNNSNDHLYIVAVAFIGLMAIVGVSVSVYLFLRKRRISK